MRTLSVRELHNRLKAVLADVERGETVEIRRRNRPVARLVPLAAQREAAPWPDLVDRVRKLYGGRRREPVSALIVRDRGD